MKTYLKAVLVTGCLILTALQTQATIIAQWNFETTTTPAGQNNSTTFGPVDPITGIGAASGFHARSQTDWSTPVGNGSANSLSANEWTAGDYWQFRASTTGFDTISLNWAQTSTSGTGPTSFKLAYSTTGIGAFTDVTLGGSVNGVPILGGTYTVGTASWSSGATRPTLLSFDLSALSINNEGTVYFRLLNLSSPVTSGTSRVDDFTISGEAITAVPEASTWYAGLGLGLIMLGSFVRKNRK